MYLNKMLISREIFDDIKTKRMKPKNKIEAVAVQTILKCY